MDARLHKLVAAQSAQIRSQELSFIAQTKTYPAGYEEYQETPLQERLTHAVALFHDLAPSCGKRGGSITMPEHPFTFDISGLVSDSSCPVQAQIAYSEGLWISALNDTDITKHPHLKIMVSSQGKVSTESSYFGDLEQVQRYHYRASEPPEIEYRAVIDPGWRDSERITDITDPFFQETVSIIDLGVKDLYSRIINPRLEALGSVAIIS